MDSGCYWKKFSGVKGLIYVLETPNFEHPQQLQFIFLQAEKVDGLKCGKDG